MSMNYEAERERVFYYDLPTDREENIAKLAGCDTRQVREWVYADWPNTSEHYAWLQSASDAEVARWLADCIRA